MGFTSLLPLAFAAVAVAKTAYWGVAISGGEFGCDIDGVCLTEAVQMPLTHLGGADGEGQMRHFLVDDGMNMFRLPVHWQWLVNNKIGALDKGNFAAYDELVQTCLKLGAWCNIDVHNYARYDKGIIGQGGPTDADFVDLWVQLATHYAKEEKVVFALMNEPHHVDIDIWAATLQKVVTGIRKAGATSQMILLSGNNFDSAASLIADGSADALLGITNPDGSTDGLLLDIHKYLDIDNSGTHMECVTDNVEAFSGLAKYLRKAKRQGFISETGASSDPTCLKNFCSQNAFIHDNPDVFVGLLAWAAGSFTTDYIMGLVPTKKGEVWTDNALMSQCVVGTYVDSIGEASPKIKPPPASSTSTTVRPKATVGPPPATTLGSSDPDATGSASTTNPAASAAGPGLSLPTLGAVRTIVLAQLVLLAGVFVVYL